MSKLNKMVKMMDWESCERDFIRKVEIDKERIKSILEKAFQRLERAKKTEGSET